MHREPEVLVARVPVEECFDCLARNLHQSILWKMASSSLFYKCKSGCRIGAKCSYAHRQVDEQPSKRSKKKGDKSAVAMLKSTRQLGCASQDMEPPKSSSILRKSSNMRKSIRRVQFTSRCTSRWHSRHEWLAQVILISVIPMLQNLRIGLRNRRNGKSDVPVKQRGGWLKASQN